MTKYILEGKIKEEVEAESKESAEALFKAKYPKATEVLAEYPYPEFVMIKDADGLGCSLRRGSVWYNKEESITMYHRVAGQWEVHTKIVDGKLLIDSKDLNHLEHLDGLELIEVTYDVWGKDNAGYTDDPKYDERGYGL